MPPILQALRRAGRAVRTGDIGAISRRYFISNGFDGTLTAIGITVGAFLSGVETGRTVVMVGLGATIGLATSGVWSVWEIERAEKMAELQEVESAMLRGLDDTRLTRWNFEDRVINALMSGLGPVIAMVTIISPFLFAGTLISMYEAALASVALGVAVLFLFGAYMGSISKQQWWVAGARMGLAGLVVALLNVLLPG